MLRAGVDLGGTKTEIAVLGPDGTPVLRRRTPTPSGYRDILDEIARLADAAAAEVGPLPRLGVGIPGSIGPRTGRIRNANTTALNGQDLATDLGAATGREIRLENDANCFALAEAQAGAGQGAASVFGVILGTGVGGGIVIDGRLWQGASRIAGEWGHVPLPAARDDERPGPDCYCSRQGCLETWLSGPGLGADHSRVTGVRATAEEIAAVRDPGAQGTLARHADRLARGLSLVVNILDPEVIVLGGGLSNLPGLAERVEALLAPHVFSDAPETRVLRNRLGDSAGVIGAAWLWPDP